MYCSNCGAKLPDHTRFCSKCGTPLEGDDASILSSETAQSHKSELQFTTSSVDDSYYGMQFQRIRQGEKPSFNFAAFLFGPFNQFYHKSYTLFLKSYLPVYGLLALYLYQNWNALVRGGNFQAIQAGVNTAMSLEILVYFCLATWNGFTYNRNLYKQVNGDSTKVEKSVLSVIVLFILFSAT